MGISDNIPPEQAQDLRSIIGPSFLEGLPDAEEWNVFLSHIISPGTREFAILWYDKAVAANGVPVRKNFSFAELVKYGTNLFMARLNEDNRWATTYCGSEIVEKSGFDATGKLLDDFGVSETLDFWLDNLKIIVGEQRPVLEFHSMDYVDKEYLHCTALNLPLRSEAESVPDRYVAHEFYSRESLMPHHFRF